MFVCFRGIVVCDAIVCLFVDLFDLFDFWMFVCDLLNVAVYLLRFWLMLLELFSWFCGLCCFDIAT